MTRSNHQASVDQLGEFDTIIDARSPAEYAEDHLPGAISLPVLSDTERAKIGTLYKQVSSFEAKKLGAALVARNIARHIEEQLLDKPKSWRPLVYCWRGGQRSGAFSLILREIGWDANRLQGGYKAWRRHVVDRLDSLPARYRFQVISGATGSGKSRLLEALANEGAQILHLEKLAVHKGSVLGNMPGQAQPTQKGFESDLFAALSVLDTQRPVFVEAESRKIGKLHLPDSLTTAIRQSPCIQIKASIESRIEFLLRDYDYATTDPSWLRSRLSQLSDLQSRETLARWHAWIETSEYEPLVRELLELHYDPLYQRSQNRNFTGYGEAYVLTTDDLSPQSLQHLARQICTATSAGTNESSSCSPPQAPAAPVA